MPVFRKNRRNILFIHVPKCGGTSVERAFAESGYETLFLDGRVGRGTVNHIRPCTPQHMHASMLESAFRLDRFDVIFMLVRNPITRFQSEYVWRNRKQSTLSPNADRVKKWTDDAFTGFRSNPFIYDNHIRPQYEFLVPGARVYHQERGVLTAIADLNRVFDLDLTTRAIRAKDGTTDYGLASSDVILSSDVERRVKLFYKRDFETFGYAWDGSGITGVKAPLVTRWKRSLAARTAKWAE